VPPSTVTSARKFYRAVYAISRPTLRVRLSGRCDYARLVVMRVLLAFSTAILLLAGSIAAAEDAGVPSMVALKTDDRPPKIWQPPPGEDEDALRREAMARKYDPERIAANERGRKAWDEQQKQQRLDELAGKKPQRRPKPPPPPPPTPVEMEKDEM